MSDAPHSPAVAERPDEYALLRHVAESTGAEWYLTVDDVRALASLLRAYEGAKEDAARRGKEGFYGGVCCALSAAFVDENDVPTRYVEVVGSMNHHELLAFAVANHEMELPRIRKAIRELNRQRAARASAPDREAENA